MGMLIRMRCPKCRQAFEVPHDLAGRKIRCKKCEEKMRVPVPPMLDGVVQSEAGEEGLGEADLLRYASDKFQWKWLVTGPIVLYGFFMLIALGTNIGFKHLGGDEQAKFLDLFSQNWDKMRFIIPAAAYFLGGWLIAWHSIGRTIIEPALASLVSIGGIYAIVQFGLSQDLFTQAFPDQNQFYVFLGIPFVASLIGAFVGEKLQGH